MSSARRRVLRREDLVEDPHRNLAEQEPSHLQRPLALGLRVVGREPVEHGLVGDDHGSREVRVVGEHDGCLLRLLRARAGRRRRRRFPARADAAVNPPATTNPRRSSARRDSPARSVRSPCRSPSRRMRQYGPAPPLLPRTGVDERSRRVTMADATTDLDYGLFDADNHYYEPRDCFTRYIEPEFRDRAIALGGRGRRPRAGAGRRPAVHVPRPIRSAASGQSPARCARCSAR